jgi:hypothetical protein
VVFSPAARDRFGRYGSGRVEDIVTGKRFWAHGPQGDAEPGAWRRCIGSLVRGSDGKVEFIPYLIDDDSGIGTEVVAGDITATNGGRRRQQEGASSSPSGQTGTEEWRARRTGQEQGSGTAP